MPTDKPPPPAAVNTAACHNTLHPRENDPPLPVFDAAEARQDALYRLTCGCGGPTPKGRTIIYATHLIALLDQLAVAQVEVQQLRRRVAELEREHIWPLYNMVNMLLPATAGDGAEHPPGSEIIAQVSGVFHEHFTCCGDVYDNGLCEAIATLASDTADTAAPDAGGVGTDGR
jgi:hypothetical protein